MISTLPHFKLSLPGIVILLTCVACGGDAGPDPDSTDASASDAAGQSSASADQVKSERLSEMDYEVSGDIDAILGEPLVVMGRTISVEEIKRGIVLGSAGRSLLESARLQVFIDEELDRQADAGQDLDKYEVTTGDIDAAIEEADGMVREEFAGNDEIQNSRDLFPMPEDLWIDQIKQTQLFDRVFLPEDPREYPPVTVAALTQQSEDFVERLIEGHLQKLKAAEESGEEAPNDKQGQAVFRQLMRQLIIGALGKSSETKTFKDGLPPEVALEVNGRQVMTQDIWKAIRWKVRPEDVADARQWFTRTTVAQADLEKAGHYMSEEEFDQAYFEHSDPYKDSPFSIEAVALSFKKFPSAEHYKVHYRLQESYKRMIADGINDETLTAHVAARAGDLLGLAKAEVDVILIPAFDFKLNAFKPDGWTEASEIAIACIRDLSDGMPWEAAIEKYSQWYEPPIPKSTADRSAQFSKNKGRFGFKNRNELLQQLGESDWSLFLYGSSVTDHVFFDAEVGVPTQPLRGPHGYYIAKVKQRTPPVSRINIAAGDGGHRLLVEQDFLTVRFNAYCQDLVDQL